jgi:putative oxidoreductase
MTQIMANKSTETRSTWLGLIRIVLGFLLTWKGLAFIQDVSQLQTTLERSGADQLSTLAGVTAAVIGIVTLVSGIFISVGLFTRAAAFVQITIVGAALIFLSVTNIDRSIIDVVSSFVILILLVLYGIVGSGSISFDENVYTSPYTSDIT